MHRLRDERNEQEARPEARKHIVCRASELLSALTCAVILGYPTDSLANWANHAAATALNYFAYNFIKIHRTLRMSPAMAAGVTDRLWSVEDLVALWEAYEQRRAERAA